jgi:YbbR domain-containing protein
LSFFGDRVVSNLVSNLGAKIIALVIAVVLWGVVLGSRKDEVVKEVPLEIMTSPNIVVGNEVPAKVAFRLSGPKAFLRAILDRPEEPIKVSLVGAKPGMVTYRLFSDNIRLPIGVKVQSINPTAILIKLEGVRSREIRVKVETRGVPADGFHVVKTEVLPPMVLLKGADSKIDGVNEVQTVPIDITGARTTLEREVNLDVAQLNLQVDGKNPRVRVVVEARSANFKIKNVDVRVLTSLKYKVTPKQIGVHVRAGAAELKLLDRSEVYGLLDLRDKPKGIYTLAPKVIVPPEVAVVKTVPEMVSVELK